MAEGRELAVLHGPLAPAEFEAWYLKLDGMTKLGILSHRFVLGWVNTELALMATADLDEESAWFDEAMSWGYYDSSDMP